MRRLILEHDGSLFAYFETPEQFRKNEPKRLKTSRLLDSNELSEECHLGNARYEATNWHMVIECRAPRKT